MKNKICFLLAPFCLLLNSCLPSVIFTEHQPKGFPKQDEFLSYYQGTFYCDGDQSTVKIEPFLISKERNYKVGVPLEELSEMEGVSYGEGLLHIEGYPDPLESFIKNDTLFASVNLKDTLFNLANEEHILTEFRGHQILSNNIVDEVWEVLILSLDDRSGIFLSEAFIPDDLNKLKALTPVTELIEDENMIIKISPTVNEFNRILEEGLIFHTCDHFTRIKQPISI